MTHISQKNPVQQKLGSAAVLDVVIYFANHEQFVERTLSSVFEQKADFPISIRIHDDASTDSTSNKLKSLAKSSPFPIAITRSPTNRYQHGSRFKHEFLMQTAAKYIALLDGDDYWIDPSKLSRQVEMMEQNDSLAISHHAYEVRKGSRHTETVRTGHINPISGAALASGNFIGTSTVVVRRSFVPEVLPGGFDRLKIDDWPIWALTAQNSAIGYLDRAMSVYQLHETNYFANQGLEEKKLQTLMAMVYIANSVDPAHQSLWLRALETRVKSRPSLLGQLVELKRKLGRRPD